jgi:hypothetical protein
VPERLAGEFFDPVVDADARSKAEERLGRWLSQAAVDERSTERLLARRHSGRAVVGAGLGPVRLTDPERLPPWAEAALWFVAAQAPTAADDPVSSRPGGIFESIGRAASALLDSVGAIPVTAVVTEEARRSIVETLGVRLWAALQPAVEFELRLNGSSEEPAAGVLDVSADGWLSRFEMLPGVAYVLGLTCHQWRRSIGEVFSRLEADMPLLREELWDGTDPGPLVGFKGDAGDRHNGGRAVALLEFASGHGVVYKPKDLSQTRAVMDLVAFLNTRHLPLELATRTVLVRPGYGWEERVVPTGCATTAGFTRFYRRLGMLTRLAQLLEGRDLWADNLLAIGDQPVLIDLECVLYPRVMPPPGIRHLDLLEAYDETVARSGMVVQPWVPRPDLPVRDLGCLSRAGDATHGYFGLPLPPYRPWSGGVVADPWDYGADVVAGYCDMQTVLAACQNELRSPVGPLSAFRGVEVRYIWRHTWDCQRILRVASSPRALLDGAEREIVLARILRDAYRLTNADPTRTDLVDIAEAELAAFRDLDVPLFLARTDSKAPSTPRRDRIGPHFVGTAWDRLRARVEQLAAFPLDHQVAVVRACLDAARNGDDIPPERETATGGHRPGTDRIPSLDELLDVAAAIGDGLLATRMPGRDGGGWLGVSWYPVPDLYQVEVAGSDLLTGTGAISIFLAELAVAVGDRRYATTARETLEDLCRLAGDSFAFTTNVRLAGGAPVPGGFTGPGAAMYALGRCAPLLGDPSLVDVAKKFIQPAADAARSPLVCADAPFGVAGLLLNTLRLRQVCSDPELDDLIVDLVTSARASVIDPAPRFAPYAPTSRISDLTPTGRDSVAMALGLAADRVPHLGGNPESLSEALATHRYDLQSGGGRLAALVGGRAQRPARSAWPRTTRLIVSAAGEELAARNRPAALAHFATLLGRRRRSGRWYPDRWVDDRLNLSALDGMVAVGLLALALVDPNIHPLTVLR